MRKIFLLTIAFMALAFTSCTTVDSAEVGIKYKKWSSDENLKGGVVGTCKGFVWYNPFTESVFKYETFVQPKDYEVLSVNTKDASTFTMDPTIAYRLDADRATDVFVKFRKPLKDIENGYMRTCIYDAYRLCANRYTADELMANRAKFEDEVYAQLDSILSREGFFIEQFTSNITPPKSLQNAINAKNEAVQNALKADNQVKEAEAKARIQIAQAEGEAQALRIKADGEAYYNKTVAQSLNEILVRQYALEKWDGKLPQYTTGANTLPLIGLK